jgi:peptidoglycan biosynthesis protein MviN/MurJ (putative lipid II flippase)
MGLNFALVPRFGMMGAAWANAVAYAMQALLAYRFSQRFYPIAYETRRILLVVTAALVACFGARALPAMHPIAGVLVRGTTVAVLYTAILAVTGFFRPEEVRALLALRRGGAQPQEAPTPEVTELAGEIIAAELPQEEPAAPVQPEGRR